MAIASSGSSVMADWALGVALSENQRKRSSDAQRKCADALGLLLFWVVAPTRERLAGGVDALHGGRRGGVAIGRHAR